MTFTFNDVDLMPYVADGGITWRRKDIEGGAAGTAINGQPIRDKVAEQYQWTLKFMPLTLSEISTILTAVKPAYAPATFTDPETGTEMTDPEAFANAADITLKRTTRNGVEYFNGLQIPITTYKGA